MNVIGTKTEKNLLAAFEGESMAAMRYNFFAKKAKKEGYEQIKAFFEETAHNEIQHAKLIFDFLQAEGTTKQNLETAAWGEREEWVTLYKESAEVAKLEGFTQIATFFEQLAEIEKEHETRFLALLSLLDNDLVFTGDSETIWICRNCGHIHVGAVPPLTCPVCNHPQAYFERKSTNY